jgi:hypothetical protein
LETKKISVESLFSDDKLGENSKSEWVSSYNINERKILLSKEEFIMNDMIQKVWVLSFHHNGNFMNYGPISTFRVFLFLKNVYLNLPQIEKDKKNFMVVDFCNDVHYQPDNLYEILKTDFPGKFHEEDSKKKSTDFNGDYGCATLSRNPQAFNSLFQPFGKVKLHSGLKENFPSFKHVNLNDKRQGYKSLKSKFSNPNFYWRKESFNSNKSNQSGSVSTKYSSSKTEDNFDSKKKVDSEKTLEEIFS